jgi:hypothetical protein
MALVLADRVQEYSTTTGTGTLTLSGAYAGFQTFATGIGNGNTCYYTITSDTNQWEVGIGTVGVGTLARTTLISSSTGSLVSFVGTLTVFVTYPAEKAVYSDSTTIVAPAGALLPVTSGGTGAATAAAARIALGLGTIATQAANSVAITGGAIDGTTVGSTTVAAGSFSTLNSSGDTRLGGLSGNQSLQVNNVASAVNYLQAVGAVTTGAPVFSAQGTDANISLPIISKGTGAIDLVAGSSGVNISNGGTVTAITRTATGSGYTTNPSVVISAPTTAGGVQATASTNYNLFGIGLVSGGTGYTVSDVITIVGGTFTDQLQLTVTAVSAGVITSVSVLTGSFGIYSALPPSTPATVTGGTGTGATFNLSWSLRSITVATAGSGYIEQPTISITGGGGSGAAAYANIGSSTSIKSLGSTLSFNTTGGTQLRISDTNSVNYWQVTGAATSGGIIFGAQGTDTNIYTFFDTKGTEAHGFRTGGGQQVRIASTASAVNYVQLTGAATTGAPNISTGGSDANINLKLTPKGTGTVQFGTYTAGILAQAGYITITDAGGTSRRLLVG